MNSTKRQDWRHWLAGARHPARKDGTIALAGVVLTCVIALLLWLLWLRQLHLDVGATAGLIALFVAVAVAWPPGWLTWATFRNASRSGADRSASVRAVRVSKADPRRLGVHAAISVRGVPDEVPPKYVPRDVDAAESGVRAKVAAASERGGFVLLVGGSSVGKTRCAFEAVKALLPDWWLVHPAGSDQVTAMTAAPRRTVVWLDELQRYLDGEHGLTGGVVRALLNAPGSAVIVGTLWPDLYEAYTRLPDPGGPDPHAREREVLDLADVVRIGPEFNLAEQDRARAAAVRDPRLQVALESAGYGLTQTLAAAPQLVARWDDAQTTSPYAWAVLTAALDAARLGARAPLDAEFLRAAVPGYCTSRQQAEAPGDWFERALAYATAKLHGAAAALAPAGTGIGQIAGYTAADYLVQHASRERRSARVPASTWDAALSYIHNPADAVRLADSARNRLLYRYAIPLYRHATDAGDKNAAKWLAMLLAERGDPDKLRADAADDQDSAWRLARLLSARGDLDELRVRADAGDEAAAIWLARLLAWRGDLEGLRARADVGDFYATRKLAYLLAQRGDLDGAIQVLRARTDARDKPVATRQRIWGERIVRGELDGSIRILRARADAGYMPAAARLAGLLAKRGDLEGLRAQVDVGDLYAAMWLAMLLAGRVDLDELRVRADAGDTVAAERLAAQLSGRGDLDELRARADAGDQPAVIWLAMLLAERGDLERLRARADVGERPAAARLAGLLAERGDLERLRAQVATGDEDAGERLAELLIKQGPAQEAERLRQFGLNPDGSVVCA